MRWLLAGCCGLALISISVCSVVPNGDVPIIQKPRFIGVNTRYNVTICCLFVQEAKIEWYKDNRYNKDDRNRRKINTGERLEALNNDPKHYVTFLIIYNVRVEDSGVYYCKSNNTWGPGTELQVARVIDLPKALHRSKMKDGLMILQGLLLAVCIAFLLLSKRQLLEKRDSIYEEPETDHIYEGLAIETCGDGLYEELSVYAQAEDIEGAEAPWE